jgi:hypothetical protein
MTLPDPGMAHVAPHPWLATQAIVRRVTQARVANNWQVELVRDARPPVARA